MSDEGNVRNPAALVPLLVAGLVIAVTSCVTLIGTNVYNIWYRNKQLDEAALQQRIKEDERFKALMTENQKLLFEVTRIADGVHSTAAEIVSKLDQIIQTMIQQDFATKIQEPMNILMNAYETHIRTLAKQALLDLNVTCQKYIPQDIIAVMKVKTTEMYKQQLKESILDEGYDLISRLEDGYLVQYLISVQTEYKYAILLKN
uniref:Uncharacterized protein n=1 Tax=Panagrolaimus sp. PS1159 TaxID=55785 RepID=A0AC35ESV9_9BILA